MKNEMSDKNESNVCEHGGLRRKCEICELREELDETLRQLAEVTNQRDDATKAFLEEMDAIYDALECLDGKESLMDGIHRMKRERLQAIRILDGNYPAIDSFDKSYGELVRKTSEHCKAFDEAMDERDEARECLSEAVQYAEAETDVWPGLERIKRWRKAAGMEIANEP